MTCEEAAELVGAYALDALPADEAAEFRRHIAGCAEHAQQAADLRRVARALPALAEPVGPPPRLRARVLGAIAADASVKRGGPEPVAIDRGRRFTWARWMSERRTAWALAAAVVLVAALLAWNIVLMNADGDGLDVTHATAVTTLQAQGAPGSGTVLYFEDDGKAVLIADGLEPLDETLTYQLWTFEGETPVSLGTANPNEDGTMRVVAEFDPGRSRVLAVTIEPAGGSEAPTRDPSYVAEFQEF